VLATTIAKTHGCAFDEEFLAIANAEAVQSALSFPWSNLFNAATGQSKTGVKIGGLSLPLLHSACVTLTEHLVAQPSDANNTSAIGDEDLALTQAILVDGKGDDGAQANQKQIEQKQKNIIEKLAKLLSQTVLLSFVPNSEFDHLVLTRMMADAREVAEGETDGVTASSAIGNGKSAIGDGKQGKKNSSPKKDTCSKSSGGTMFLCFAELFPLHVKTHCPDSFRGVITDCAPEFLEVVKWLVMAKQPADSLIISDGRSEVARRHIRDLLTKLCNDDFTELWVIYDMETSLHTDVRNPKRKVAWSAANMEVLFVILSKKTKGQRGIVARDSFNKCGESTNFSRSYTGVPFRNIAEIPRFTKDAKAKILGPAAVGTFGKSRVAKEVDAKGHPLFWSEWKPVALYSTLFRDFQVGSVVDLTPGSGAACLASLYTSTKYIGFAHNQAHKEWLQDYMQRLFVAMVSEQKVPADEELVKNVSKYLQRSSEAAKLMLPKKGSVIGDSFTGDDDSDVDE
jgi:hypothetical protein